MKATMTALIAVLTIGLVGLVAGNAAAHGDKHSGGGNSDKHSDHHSSFSFGVGSYGCESDYHKVYVKKVYVEPVLPPCINPLHSLVFVNPGDSWFSICLREYGNPNVWTKVVVFNGLPLNAPLAAGMQLRLPVIHPDGGMSPSFAPAAIVLGGPAPTILPQGGPIPQANFVPQAGGSLPQAGGMPQFNGGLPQGPTMNPQSLNGPNANVPVASDEERTEERLPSVAAGSILTLDGQQLGNERGVVRLRISGVALPIEVLEWNASFAKIQLPKLDVTSAMKAEIEVLRADGSLASKSAVELTPTTTRLALEN